MCPNSVKQKFAHLKANDSKWQRCFRIIGLLAIGTISGAVVQARAATTDGVTACAVQGAVTVTVAGIPTTVPVSCLNEAQQTSPGSTDQATANVSTPTLLGLPSLASIDAPDSKVSLASSAGGLTLTGATTASNVALVSGLVNARDVQETLSCVVTSGGSTPTCQSSTTIGSLTLGGQAQILPTPIPQNYTLPLQGNITVEVLGQPTTLGVSGNVVLNEMKISAVNYGEKTQHDLIHASLHGQATALGVGLVDVNIDLDDVVTVYPYEY